MSGALTSELRTQVADSIRHQWGGRDESDLIWFYSKAAIAFERSLFGFQLERARMFSISRRPCFLCRGTGFINAKLGKAAKTTKKARLVDNADLFHPLDADCPRCSGLGYIQTERAAPYQSMHGQVFGKGPEECAECGCKIAGLKCSECGWSPGFTANITAEIREPAKYFPNVVLLQRFASISRSITAVARVAPKSAAAIEAYWGDRGARWSVTPYNRIFAVYPLTDSGEALLGQVASKHEGPPDERLRSIYTLNETKRNKQRTLLFKQADDEAREIYLEGVRLWAEFRARKS